MAGMALLPPENVRKLRSRMGGLALAAKHDPKEYTAAGTAAFLSRFEREVDPDGTLPPAERARRADAARRLYFTRLSLQSVKARRKARKIKNAAASTSAAFRESDGGLSTDDLAAEG